MPEKMLLFALLVAGMLLFMAVDYWQEGRKRSHRIRVEFGKVPSPCYRRTRIAGYWQQLARCAPPAEAVDDTTWNDLGLDEVYDCINVCQSAIGEDYLYAVLRSPAKDARTLQDRERLLHALEDEALRVDVQVLLAKLGRCIGTDLPALLFETDTFSLDRVWHFVAGMLALPVCALASLWLGGQGLVALAGVAVHNIWLFAETKKRLGSRVDTVGYLTAALSCARKLQARTAVRCPEYAALLEKTLEPLRKAGGGAAALLLPSGTDVDSILRILQMITLLPMLRYHRSVKLLARCKAELRLLYCLLGELDAAASVLSYRYSLPLFTVPTFEQTAGVHARGLVHPLLESGVENDADIAQSWLLTGSNASGKSTFLKAVALNCILAQTIHTCTARAFALRLAPVVTSMAVEDNVQAGESYFVAEVKSMRRIVAAADTNAPCYCFLDELLKGTNTTERVAAASAMLRYLHKPSCVCVAATHDLELTVQLADIYENYHFSEHIGADGVLFDYTLKPGPSTTRNAIRLLETYDFPQALVSQARAAAGEEKQSVQQSALKE